MRLPLLIAGFVITLMMSAAADAYAETAKEEELKAAYLLNFALFIEWPATGAATFTICQYGTAALGAGAEALSRRTIRGKAITVRSAINKQIQGCDLLYIGAAEKSRIREITQALRGTSTLTVSDAPDAAREGAIIGLLTAGQKLVFEINVAEARRNNLVISAKLLSLAQSVMDAP